MASKWTVQQKWTCHQKLTGNQKLTGQQKLIGQPVKWSSKSNDLQFTGLKFVVDYQQTVIILYLVLFINLEAAKGLITPAHLWVWETVCSKI